MITPSFNLTATERVLPKLALDFTTASLDPRITFARSLATATRVNSSGYIEAVAADTPRFDFDPVTLACKGLLIEESRINSKTYSQAFSGTGWSSYQLTRNDNVAGTLSPVGLGNAGSVIEDNNSGVHTFYPDNPFTSVIGTTYTISFFIKANGRSRFNLRVASTANPIVGTFLANGVFDVAAGTYVSGTNSGASIQAFADGWYRCSLSVTATTTTVAYGISLISSGTTTNYTGDGVSGLYVFGAQFEAGAFPTSYIPTEATAVTRNADFATMTGTNFSDWFNPTEGTFVASGTTPEGIGTLFTANDGTNTSYIALIIRTNIAGFSGIVVNNSINQVIIGPQLSTNTFYNMALAYKHDDFALSYDGNSPYIDTAGSIPTVDRLHIAGIVSEVRTVTISKLSYYPMRLKNAEVIAFSK